MEKELRDYFKIDDSHSKIRGFVVIRDADGKILVKKENMIVKSGRQLILNAITGGTGFNMKNDLVMRFSEKSFFTEETTEFYEEKRDEDGNTIYQKDADGNFITDASGNKIPEKESIFTDGIKYLVVNEDSSEWVTVAPNIIGEPNSKDCSITYEVTITSESDKTLNSMGLCLGDTLFSRVVFNTIELSANSKLTLTYYIYF